MTEDVLDEARCIMTDAEVWKRQNPHRSVPLSERLAEALLEAHKDSRVAAEEARHQQEQAHRWAQDSGNEMRRAEAAERRLAEAEKALNSWLDYHAKKYPRVHVCRQCEDSAKALRGTDAVTRP